MCPYLTLLLLFMLGTPCFVLRLRGYCLRIITLRVRARWCISIDLVWVKVVVEDLGRSMDFVFGLP
jgi:hypothetical protein